MCQVDPQRIPTNCWLKLLGTKCAQKIDEEEEKEKEDQS